MSFESFDLIIARPYRGDGILSEISCIGGREVVVPNNVLELL